MRVYDHFHIIKLMNGKLDKVRRDTYNPNNETNPLIKARLLLANGDNQSTSAESGLYKALDINRPLATAILPQGISGVYGGRTQARRGFGVG